MRWERRCGSCSSSEPVTARHAGFGVHGFAGSGSAASAGRSARLRRGTALPPVAAGRFERGDHAVTRRRPDARSGNAIPRLRPEISNAREAQSISPPRTPFQPARRGQLRQEHHTAHANFPGPSRAPMLRLRRSPPALRRAYPRTSDARGAKGRGAPRASVRPRSIRCAISTDEAACSERRGPCVPPATSRDPHQSTLSDRKLAG